MTTVKWIGVLLSAEEVLSKCRLRVMSQKEFGRGRWSFAKTKGGDGLGSLQVTVLKVWV